MSITGVGGFLAGARQYAGRTQGAAAKKEDFSVHSRDKDTFLATAAAEKISGAKEQSEAEEMAAFKRQFYGELSAIAVHGSISNAAVNISEAAFKAMKEDPEYKEKVLSLLRRDLGSSLAPRSCSVLLTVGATLDEYRGDSWPVGYDGEFHKRAKDSFYKSGNEKKDEKKEILEAYEERRVREKKLRQRMQEEKLLRLGLDRSRLMQPYGNE